MIVVGLLVIAGAITAQSLGPSSPTARLAAAWWTINVEFAREARAVEQVSGIPLGDPMQPQAFIAVVGAFLFSTVRAIIRT